MKNLITLTTFIFLCKLSYGQTPNVELALNGKKVAYYIELEKKLGSIEYKANSTFYSGGNTAQPQIFLRREKGIPDLLVYYTPLKKDSTVSEILYEWDVYNFDKKDDNKQTLDFQKNLIAKYNDIIKLVTQKHGKSEVKGDLSDLTLTNSSSGLKRNDKWNVNDSLEIESYITISNYYKKDNFITTNPTHRIRLYLKSNKKEKPLEISVDQLKVYDNTVASLFKNLADDNFEEAKKLFSEQIANTVNIEVLKKVKESIKAEKQLKLYMKGQQLLQDGNQYPMLQYRYADDASSVPNQVIVVLFDQKNKILGFRPLVRQ